MTIFRKPFIFKLENLKPETLGHLPTPTPSYTSFPQYLRLSWHFRCSFWLPQIAAWAFVPWWCIFVWFCQISLAVNDFTLISFLKKITVLIDIGEKIYLDMYVDTNLEFYCVFCFGFSHPYYVALYISAV